MYRLRVFLLLVIFFLTPVYADNSLPDLGNPNDRYLSATEIREYGEAFLSAIYRQFTVIDDPLVASYLHDLGFRLAGSTNDGDGLHFEFLAVVTPVINAMTGPNGIIAIASGLILASDNESQLAGVIAHEIAHVTQGHFSAGYAYSQKMTPVSIGLMLAALAVATQNSQAGSGAIAATAAGTGAATLKTQRGYEQEADRIGMQILKAAGFDPKGMLDFFMKLQSDARYYGTVPGFLSDHPLTNDRIADLSNRVQTAASTPKKTGLRYRLIKERVRVVSNSNKTELLMYYQQKLKKQLVIEDKNAFEYGYALTLIESKQFAEGEQRLRALMNAYPDEVIYTLSLAESYLDDNKPTQAIALLKPALQLNPDYYPLVITYGIALEHAHQYHEAARYLRDALPQFSTYPLLYVALSKAQAADHHLAEAYQTRAKAFLLVGNTQGALQQLRTASRLPDLTPNQRSAIGAEIKRLTPEE